MARKQRYEKPVKSGIFVRSLQCKNDSQDFYLQTLAESTVTLCSGPAGTGKTFLATFAALTALANNEVNKILLTRPIVACEDLGYLPGDANEKVLPYMYPLLDSIDLLIGQTKRNELFDNGKIEIVPLAYTRGRTFTNVYAVLDEAQNCTREQIKMFLTRIGDGTKLVINGDARQSDLPRPGENGLSWAVQQLRGVSGEISVIEFSGRDIVRHPLISTILNRLEGPTDRAADRHAFYR